MTKEDFVKLLDSNDDTFDLEIDVAMAEFLLLNFNQGNRNIKEFELNHYITDMKNGKWYNTGEPIKFTKFSEGYKITDGQHRLHAIIRSGSKLKFKIFSKLPEDCITKLNPITKSDGDILKITGTDFGNKASHSRIATFGSAIITGPGVKCRISQSLRINKIKKIEEAILFAIDCMPKNQRMLSTAPVRSVAGRAFYHFDSYKEIFKTKADYENEVMRFFKILISPVNKQSDKDDAAVLLNTYLQGDRARHLNATYEGRIEMYQKVSYALDNFLRGKIIKTIRRSFEDVFSIKDII